MAVTINASTSTGLVQSADTSGEIELQSNGTTALKVNTNEGIQILNCLGVGNATPSTSGAGITFPATQSASTDANTLDDYEEGTWTPVLGGFSSVTFSYNTGSYIKIGRMVYVFWDFEVTSRTGSWNDLITGLPFTVSPNMAGYSVVLHRSSNLFGSSFSGGQLKGFVNQNTTDIALQVDNSGTAGFGLAGGATVNSSGRSTGCVMYTASN